MEFFVVGRRNCKSKFCINRAWIGRVSIAFTTLIFAACGGGNKDANTTPLPPAPAPAPVLPTRIEAARFLTQATFGPTENDINAVMAKGYEAWLEEQFQHPPSVSHLEAWDVQNRSMGGGDIPIAVIGARGGQLPYSFWKQSIAGSDQVRARVAFAWSQIFVVSSTDDSVFFNTRSLASYYDMLNQKAFGQYRDLLESVSLHPSMGMFLTSIKNRKEDQATGRVPDENYAREVMQLFSIGLYELNLDGSLKINTSSVPIPTYTSSDISNLAKVFTGWSWACPSTSNQCFNSGVDVGSVSDTNRLIKPMKPYPQFHSTGPKKFLNVTIPDQGSNPNPEASLKVALDALAAHSNVAPFVAKQLIQRLVTSNPSPAYVSRVAGAFQASKGNLKAVTKAVLLDPDARTTPGSQNQTFGKLREPILRATAFFRAFNASSSSGNFLIGITDDPGTSLGQTPLRAPSVFNFYRPGFKPNTGFISEGNLLAPEMQTTHETSVAGYANTMRDWVDAGAPSASRDIKPSYLREPSDPLIALADTPVDLVSLINQRLLYGTMPTALGNEIIAAISKITIPAPNGTNQTAINTARLNRLKSAIYLTLLSPEFVVQK
jgi:uncharacterized protein (DUF1800 family)